MTRLVRRLREGIGIGLAEVKNAEKAMDDAADAIDSLQARVVALRHDLSAIFSSTDAPDHIRGKAKHALIHDAALEDGKTNSDRTMTAQKEN